MPLVDRTGRLSAGIDGRERLLWQRMRSNISFGSKAQRASRSSGSLGRH